MRRKKTYLCVVSTVFDPFMPMHVSMLRAVYIGVLMVMALLQARGALWLLPDPEWVVAGFAFFMMLFAFENLSLHEDIRELRATSKCDTEQCTTNAST